MESIFKKGLIYSAIGKYSNIVIQLIINAILSRILTPDEYGTISIVQVFIVFFQMLIDAGMGPAIIQNKSFVKEDYDILFNYSALISAVSAIIFGLMGKVISFIYEDNIFYSICWLLALYILFIGLNIVPTAYLNKNKQFKLITLSLIVSSVFSGLVGIVCALNGFGVYSLVCSMIVTAFVNMGLNIFFTKIFFSRNFNIKPLKEISSFALNQLGFNVINYFSRNLDNLIIGRTLGKNALGNYSKVYQLLLMPNTVFLGVITPVMQPVLSDHQDDVKLITNFYLKIIRFLALIGIPLSVFLSNASEQVITIIYGPQWQMAVIPFKIVSLTVWVQLILSSTGAVFQARNKPKLLFRTGIISSTILVAAIILGSQTDSLNKFSLYLAVGFLCNFLVSGYILMRFVLETSFLLMLRQLVKPASIAIVIYIGLTMFDYFSPPLPLFILFICKVIISGIIFLIGCVLLKEKDFILNLFKSNHSYPE